MVKWRSTWTVNEFRLGTRLARNRVFGSNHRAPGPGTACPLSAVPARAFVQHTRAKYARKTLRIDNGTRASRLGLRDLTCLPHDSGADESNEQLASEGQAAESGADLGDQTILHFAAWSSKPSNQVLRLLLLLCFRLCQEAIGEAAIVLCVWARGQSPAVMSGDRKNASVATSPSVSPVPLATLSFP